MTSYDEAPYESRAVTVTHVDRLAFATRLRGLSPAPPSSCSVLELGFAEAANLLAMAYHLDECRFVGVDLSKVHIERGLEARDRLGLDNLELRCASFKELGDDLGTFDYVIVHGVLSWVDDATRARLLDTVRARLSENGVAFISYNCAAGWATQSELRAFLLEHTAGLTSPEERVTSVREVLELLAASPLAESSRYAASLAEQAVMATHRGDSYLLHEYLSEHNHAFRHRELLELVEAHGLGFLAELAAAAPIPGLEDGLRAGLAKRFEDPVRTEDLVDLMVGRAFRASLFVHRAVLPDEVDERAQALALADEAFFRAEMAPAAKRFSLDKDVAETFVTPDGIKVAARSHVLKAALLEISKWWPRGLSLPHIVERINLILELRRVHEPGEQVSEEEIDGLRSDLVELFRLGHVQMALREPPVAVEPTARPRVGALTRLEAERDGVVSNPRHELIALDSFDRHLIGHLDGTRDLGELVSSMREHREAGDIVLRGEDGVEVAAEAADAAVPELTENALRKLARAGLLTPDP